MNVSTEKYESLLHDLTTIKDLANQQAQQAFNLILAESYWLMGKRLTQEELTENEKRVTFQKLSKDINIEESIIFRTVQFFLLWPKDCPVPHYPVLAWSHYKLLLSIQSDEARAFYLREAQDQKWPVRMLSQKIKDRAFLETLTHPSATANAPTLTRRSEALHVYKSEVAYVVDGDTLVINVDLGFDVWVKKRLRLRGVDTPELKAPELNEQKKAYEAKAFVKKRLPKTSAIVIQTFRVDLHGRFVADVFYLKDETDKEKIFTEGNFLNQELLDSGLAEMI